MYAAARRRIHHAPEKYFHVKKLGDMCGAELRRKQVVALRNKKAGREPGSFALKVSFRQQCMIS